MEVIETELDVGDIFKFPISKGNYNLIKRHVRNSPQGNYEVNKLIEMPDTEKVSKIDYFIIVKRVK